MKIQKVKTVDFNEVLEFGKKLLNYDFFLTKPNDNFTNALTLFSMGFLLSKVTHGYFIIDENNNKKIGVLLFSIPKQPKIFEHIHQLQNFAYNIKVYANSGLDPIESQIYKMECDTLNNSIYLQKKYKNFIANKVEINLFYIDDQYRGKGLSNSLLNAFYYDLYINKLNHFYLYTTTFYNISYYEHIGMQRVVKTIYTKENCPNFLSKKLQLPYVGFIYFGNTKDRLKKA